MIDLLCLRLQALLSTASMTSEEVPQPMPSLSVRKIDEEVYERLRVRAAEQGVSMEEEVRRIIQRAVAAPARLGQLALECFGPTHGVELELPSHEPHQPPEL